MHSSAQCNDCDKPAWSWTNWTDERTGARPRARRQTCGGAAAPRSACRRSSNAAAIAGNAPWRLFLQVLCVQHGEGGFFPDCPCFTHSPQRGGRSNAGNPQLLGVHHPTLSSVAPHLPLDKDLSLSLSLSFISQVSYLKRGRGSS